MSSVTADLTASADQEEEESETVTVTASHGGAPIGSATVTINSVSRDATLASLSLSGVDIGAFDGAVMSYEASVANAVTAEDGSTTKTYAVAVTRLGLPVVSVAAVEERVVGPIGAVRVSRTGPTGGPLEARLRLSSSDRTSATDVTARFRRSERSVTERVQIGDNNLVEHDITVTWTLQPGEGYTVSAEQSSASVVLEESEVPAFSVSVSPAGIDEGGSATLTVAITNRIRFREAQAIALAASGTASASDYTGLPAELTLAAGASSVTATLVAAEDRQDEADESVTITASHGGSKIGSATVTIVAGAAPPLAARFAGMPTTHDGAAAFTFELRFSEDVRVSYKTLRDTALDVTGGSVAKARRLAPPSNLGWELTVQPASDGDIVLVLPMTTDCGDSGAVCTAGGKALSERVTATVKGPSEVGTSGFPLAPENRKPSGIWSDGETAWVADLDDARLYAYPRSDGERQPGKDIATGPAPMGLWSDEIRRLVAEAPQGHAE